MPQQEDCLVVFESIPIICRVVKLSNFLMTPIGNVINVFEKLFSTINRESDSKEEAFHDQQFK